MIFRATTPARRIWPALILPALAAGMLAAAPGSDSDGPGKRWIGTWATAAQPALPGPPETFRNQTVRLIVHTSAGGAKPRVRISNTYGTRPLTIGSAHITLRSGESSISSGSDRTLKFRGKTSVTIPAKSDIISDPVEMTVPALSDVAVSLYFPDVAEATTSHLAAKQTSYLSTTGDFTGIEKIPDAKPIRTWPFLTGLDVEVSERGASIVALGSSLTDGDGSSPNQNRRWTDYLAARLQQKGGAFAEIGVLNEGIIGNRLLEDSPEATPYGKVLGESGIARFDRDVLSQTGVKYVFIALGVNDIAFPGSLTPASARVSAEALIAGYRRLIEYAHRKGIQVIGTTNPPFEDSFLESRGGTRVTFFTPEKEAVRVAVNEWILTAGNFDAVVDFDAAVRDPSHPAHILPGFDSGDHIHPNDEGYEATASLVPLNLFIKR